MQSSTSLGKRVQATGPPLSSHVHGRLQADVSKLRKSPGQAGMQGVSLQTL